MLAGSATCSAPACNFLEESGLDPSGRGVTLVRVAAEEEKERMVGRVDWDDLARITVCVKGAVDRAGGLMVARRREVRRACDTGALENMVGGEGWCEWDGGREGRFGWRAMPFFYGSREGARR
jgi:hypothetical protein